MICLVDEGACQFQIFPFPKIPGQFPSLHHAKNNHPTLHNGKSFFILCIILFIVDMLFSKSYTWLLAFQVTFTRTRYHEAVNRWHWQDKVKKKQNLCVVECSRTNDPCQCEIRNRVRLNRVLKQHFHSELLTKHYFMWRSFNVMIITAHYSLMIENVSLSFFIRNSKISSCSSGTNQCVKMWNKCFLDIFF